MTDQGWSNWWCERQRYGVVVAAAVAIRGRWTQTESTHRRVAMPAGCAGGGRAVLVRTDVVTKTSARALLTVVGGRGERTLRSERTSAWSLCGAGRVESRCGDVLIDISFQ